MHKKLAWLVTIIGTCETIWGISIIIQSNLKSSDFVQQGIESGVPIGGASFLLVIPLMILGAGVAGFKAEGAGYYVTLFMALVFSMTYFLVATLLS